MADCQPRILAFAGPPCTGKSTLAHLLSARLGWPHLSMDEVRSITIPDSDNRAEHRRIAYRAMHFAATHLLRAGKSIILDATYSPLEQRAAVERMAQNTGASLYLVECSSPPDLAVARFAARDPQHPTVDLTPERVRSQAQSYRFSRLGILVDSATSADGKIAEIERYLEAAHPVRLGEWSRTPSNGGARRSRAPRPDANGGNAAILQLRDARVDDATLYDLYINHSSVTRGFKIPQVPIYLIVEPSLGRRFDVHVHHSAQSFRDKALRESFAAAGVDFTSFCQDRVGLAQSGSPFFNNERVIRHTGLETLDASSVHMSVTPCTYVDYLCTEGSVNIQSASLPGGARELFEGQRWAERTVDPGDIAHTSRRFAAAVSVSVLLTTTDGFLVLQRRSGEVSQGIGNLSATASGFTSWDADFDGADDGALDTNMPRGVLRRAALRELYEEIGLREDDLLPDETPFVGAGYNLLHGRDLNFYAHFKARMSASEVQAHLAGARDRWEVESLLPIPVGRLAPGGLLRPPFDTLLRQCTRHLRGALYCLIESGSITRPD